ncbi:MAG TPA: hypothetical protein VNS63_10850 [Blastocatellia bacterium]|nr:hypothetical protein [Blastocatellia bacterium]
MNGTDDIKTAAIRACESCAAGILDCDKFCRWCGGSQHAMTTRISAATESHSLGLREPSRYLTTELPLASTSSLRRVSGPLVSAVVATLASGPVSRPRTALFATAVATLLSFPLWLMIVLLSPLDAYAAAKNLSRGL